MSNPIRDSGFAPQNANLGQIRHIMQMLNGAQNPQAVLQQVAKKNPQVAQVMQMLQGRNPQEVFYAMCQQRGVNPNDILNQLK